MNIFFGKISAKMNPLQFQEGYYDTDTKSWFNGIDVGDYAFVISGRQIELWRARAWEREGLKLNFDKIVTGIEGQTAKLIAFKHFKLFPALLSATTKSLRNIAFVPIALSKPISENDLINPKTYQTAANFRNIQVLQQLKDCVPDSEDVQLYYEHGKLNLFPAPFMEGDTFRHFRDNTEKIGGGRRKKDKTLGAFLHLDSFPKVFPYDVVNLRDLYEAFAVPYEKKEDSDDADNEETTTASNQPQTMMLNQILYGPPGTGKTYHSIEKALEILGETDFSDREATKKRFDERVEEGRIVFTTFHQSMSYEDFIEGIKPVELPVGITYRTEPGLFKKICAKAASSGAYGANFDEAYQNLLKEIQESPGKKLVLETLYQAREFTIYENSKGNLRFHANTEKAYEAVVRKDYLQHFLQTGECLDWPSYIKAIGQYLRTRHGYQDGKIGQPDNFVLIIDEINRGNISQIFGELITLIEPDKRLGKDEALTVTLPYSKEPFGVPPNLYIVGTMNTADRSVEALDTALRRRFSFEAIPPKPSLLTPNRMIWNLLLAYEQYDWDEKVYAEKEAQVLHFLGANDSVREKMHQYWKTYIAKADNPKQETFENAWFSGITLEELLKTINLRIKKLLDADHQIGHSYFMKVGTLDDLQQVFYRNVIPLLQEYFFGDYGKIGLVLGQGFVRKKQWNEKAEFSFADFGGYENEGNFDEREVFEIVQYPDATGQPYRLEINKNSFVMDFEKAIRLLLKKSLG